MAGTTFKLAPVDSTKHLYSGKYGANVMNSSPASLKALKVIVIAPAAPPVINKFLPAKLVPKRRLISLAKTSLTSGLPGATV